MLPMYPLVVITQSTDVSNLTDEQKETLQEWIVKYNTKYTVVGRLVAPAAL